MPKKILIIIIVAVLIVGGVVYYYIIRPGLVEKLAPAEEERAEEKMPMVEIGGVEMGVGVEVDIGKATENPVEIPSTNPLEDVANPFRDSYKNPFE